MDALMDGSVANKRSHWSDVFTRAPLYWLNALLFVFAAVMVLDQNLAPRVESAAIADVAGHKARTRSRAHTHIAYWSVVKLSNGVTFQTERMSTVFKVGDTLHVQRGALLGGVHAYRMNRPEPTSWIRVEAENRDFRLFPYGVLAMAILLLAPWWNTETRWFLQAIQLTMLLAWFFVLFGTNVLTWFS